MREEYKRSAVTGIAIVLWSTAVLMTVVSLDDDYPWRTLLPITVGGAATATIARYLMRTRHIMAQVYRAGRDAAKEGLLHDSQNH